MKKVLIAAFAVLGVTFSNAQEDNSGSALSEGSWVVEANTNFGQAHAGNTGFSLTSVDGNTAWGIGAEAGYFVMDNLAIKGGLGYSDGDNSDGMFSYKLGAKYYVQGMIPLQLDFNGASATDYSPMYVGLQGGYAWFVANNISVEPGLRYDFGMNEDAGDGDFNPFSVRIGFALHF